MKESLKKLKFYDTWLWVLGISFTLYILGILLFDYITNDLFMLWVIPTIGFAISSIIILWGMIYHQYQRSDWNWFIITIILILLAGLGLLVTIPYYFLVMRKEFKRGKGIYEEKLTKKERERIKYYKKHKKEIDKKEHEEFKKFLKWIGITLSILILFFIIQSLIF